MNRLTTTLAALVALLVAGTASATAPTITGTGDLTGGLNNSKMWAVTADGSTSVGQSNDATTERAVKYGSSLSTVFSGQCDGGDLAHAHGAALVSTTLHVVGHCGVSAAGAFYHNGSTLKIVDSEGAFYAIDEDATLAVGERIDGLYVNVPVVYDIAADTLTDLPCKSDDCDTYMGIAYGISPDGTLIVGADGAPGSHHAVYWKKVSGSWTRYELDPDGQAPTGANCIAYDAADPSHSGDIIVGACEYTSGTPQDWLIALWDDVSGHDATVLDDMVATMDDCIGYAIANEASHSGGLAVAGDCNGDAVYWTPGLVKPVTMEALIKAGGTSFTDWDGLWFAYGISSDGLTVVGYGDNDSADDEGFIVDLTTDLDNDGDLDNDDNCLVVSNASQADSDSDGYGDACDADYDNNGIVDAFDYLDFAYCYNNGIGATMPKSGESCALADHKDDGVLGGSDSLLYGAQSVRGEEGPSCSDSPGGC